MKKIKSTISVVLSLVMILSLYCATSAVSVSAAGTTYYVDSVSGSDSNSGTSATSAWKTLDKVNSTKLTGGVSVLLKKGCSFSGYLAPQGRGTKDTPILISSYGEGAKPIIEAGNNSYGISISERGYTVDGLVVRIKNAKEDRKGIYIIGTSYANIKNCEVYGLTADTNLGRASYSNDYSGLVGISVQSCMYTTIDNNYIENVVGNGIVTNSDNRKDAKELVIQNNSLNGIGQDGILINNATGALVQYNVVNNSHNYSDKYHVAIWPFSSDDTLLQYNEAYNTKTTKDGHGFDCDYLCTGTVFQYNYGHDNEGGFMLICTEPVIDWVEGKPPAWNNDCVIRYNIGQNNKNVQFALTGHISNTKIYNNTLYYTSGRTVTTYVRDVKNNKDKGPKNTQFYNNIFYNVNGGEYHLSYTEGSATAYATGTVWENNCFFGKHPSSEPDDPHKITANPQLVNAGGASTGLESCVAYKLKDSSPLIGAGKVIPNNGGKDFFGNPVSATANPDIGAYQSPAKSNGGTNGGGINNPTPNNPVVSVAKPAKVKNVKVAKAGKKKVKVTWKKAKNAKKYNVRYSYKKNMKGAKTKTVKALKVTLKKLKSGKKVYVQVRGVNGTKKGSWSAKKYVKVK